MFKQVMIALVAASILSILVSYILVLIEAYRKGPITFSKKVTKDVGDIFRRKVFFGVVAATIFIAGGVMVLAVVFNGKEHFDYLTTLGAVVGLFIVSLAFGQWLSDVPSGQNLSKKLSFWFGFATLVVADAFLIYTIHEASHLIVSIIFGIGLACFIGFLARKPWGSSSRRASDWFAIASLIIIIVMIVIEACAFFKLFSVTG